MKFLSNECPNKDSLMFINSIYHYPSKNNEYKDCIDLIYKDLKTGKRYLESIEKPPFLVYVTKEDERNYKHNLEFIETSRVEPHKLPFKDTIPYIAKLAGPTYQNYLRECRETGNRYAMNNIHKFPYVFGSDLDIEPFYRVHWMMEYNNELPKKINKAYLDIETDAIKKEGFAAHGEVPIICVTVVDETAMKCHTLIYRMPDNTDQIEPFEKDINNFVDSLHDDFDETYGVLEYNIYMYDDEKDLIRDMFRVVNASNVDFVAIWNISFDIPFVISRMEVLGMDPVETICHPDFKRKVAKFSKDMKNFQVANKRDYFKSSTYCQYIDQMILYAATRKGGSQLRSNKLGDTAKAEIKDTKLDYTEEANIKTLPYVNFPLYIRYNIKDVLLQMGIERKTSDLDNLYVRSYSNLTPYNHVFAQTKFLKNRAYYEFFLQDKIRGNNTNIDYGADSKSEDGVGFGGALVGDSELNSKTGTIIMGQRSKYVFEFVIDMDFSAMYPSIIISHNISPNCLIGKLLVNESIDDLFRKFNKALANIDKQKEEIMKLDEDQRADALVELETQGIDVEDQGKHFIDNLMTNNLANTGKRWFNLPGTEELEKELISRFGETKKKMKLACRVTCPDEFDFSGAVVEILGEV